MNLSVEHQSQRKSEGGEEMKKEYIVAIGAVLTLIVLVGFSLMKSISKPKIIVVSFDYYPTRTDYGLVTLQNVGGKGHVVIYAYGNEKIFAGSVHAGQVFKVQTGWWSLGTLKVVYDDGSIDYIS